MIQTLTGFSIFLGGVNVAEVISAKLPALSFKSIETKKSGNILNKKVFTGQLETLETELTLSTWDAQSFLNFAGNSKDNELIIRGVLSDGEQKQSLKIIMSGAFESIDFSELSEEADQVKLTLKGNLSLYAQEFAGKELFYIDNDSHVLRINGVDRMKQDREILGL